MRVFLTNVGCKVNQAEVEALSRQLAAAGHQLVESLEQAEVHVVNSCSVTGEAARDSRKAARRGGGKVRTVMTGCHATLLPAEARSTAGIDLVVDNRSKDRLVGLIESNFPDLAGPRQHPGEIGPAVRTRATVKVQDGCSAACTFCVIPRVRGPSRSRPLPEVVVEVDGLVGGGHKEVILTGPQLSSYCDGDHSLYDLVAAVLDATAVRRLRLSSLAPWELDARLLRLGEDPRFCRHFHLSLQAGCDATLQRMRRPHTVADFTRVTERLRSAFPDAAITTDVMVGFPGETEQEFRKSLETVVRLGFARAHVFPFSPRPGSAAARLPGQVSRADKKRRAKEMREVTGASQAAFVARHVGQTLNVLWEEQRQGLWYGHTGNYLRVAATSQSPLRGRIAGVAIRAADGDLLHGTLV